MLINVLYILYHHIHIIANQCSCICNYNVLAMYNACNSLATFRDGFCKEKIKRFLIIAPAMCFCAKHIVKCKALAF